MNGIKRVNTSRRNWVQDLQRTVIMGTDTTCGNLLRIRHRCDSRNIWKLLLLLFFSFLGWGGVILSPLGTLATIWHIVPATGHRWVRRIWWNENWQGKPKYSKKTCPSATLSTTNPTWPDRRSNTGRYCRKPATNRLRYDTGLLLTPWSRVPLAKPPVAQLLKEVAAFYGARWFITVFPGVRHWTLP
jgi:hypothetical protein